MPPKFELHIHFTKSLKRDNIYKLCLWKLGEHNCVILTSYHVQRLDIEPMLINVNLHCTESLKREDIETYGL